MASILSRFHSIMSANINAMLDKAEDPEKMIDQNLRELRENLAEVKSETATVMADEKKAERQLDACNQNIADCNKAARNALASGNEEDARKIIAKKQEYEASKVSLQQTYDAAHANSEKMRAMYTKLADDISTLEARKDSIKEQYSLIGPFLKISVIRYICPYIFRQFLEDVLQRRRYLPLRLRHTE